MNEKTLYNFLNSDRFQVKFSPCHYCTTFTHRNNHVNSTQIHLGTQHLVSNDIHKCEGLVTCFVIHIRPLGIYYIRNHRYLHSILCCRCHTDGVDRYTCIYIAHHPIPKLYQENKNSLNIK